MERYQFGHVVLEIDNGKVYRVWPDGLRGEVSYDVEFVRATGTRL